MRSQPFLSKARKGVIVLLLFIVPGTTSGNVRNVRILCNSNMKNFLVIGERVVYATGLSLPVLLVLILVELMVVLHCFYRVVGLPC